MIAQELEVGLHMAFVDARQSAMSSSRSSTCCSPCWTTRAPPRCCAPARSISTSCTALANFINEHTPRLPQNKAERHHAHPGLPARHPARDPACAVVGQKRSDRRQCARRHLRREGFARGLFPEPARRHASRRGELHQPRHQQGAPKTTTRPRLATARPKRKKRRGAPRTSRSTSMPRPRPARSIQ